MVRYTPLLNTEALDGGVGLVWLVALLVVKAVGVRSDHSIRFQLQSSTKSIDTDGSDEWLDWSSQYTIDDINTIDTICIWIMQLRMNQFFWISVELQLSRGLLCLQRGSIGAEGYSNEGS